MPSTSSQGHSGRNVGFLIVLVALVALGTVGPFCLGSTRKKVEAATDQGLQERITELEQEVGIATESRDQALTLATLLFENSQRMALQAYNEHCAKGSNAKNKKPCDWKAPEHERVLNFCKDLGLVSDPSECDPDSLTVFPVTYDEDGMPHITSLKPAQ